MQIKVMQGDIKDQAVDCLLVDHFEGETTPARAAEWVDKSLDGALTNLLAAGDFTGKAGTTALLYTNGKLPAARVLVLGLGKLETFTTRTLRSTAATAARTLSRLQGVHTVASVVPGLNHGGISTQDCAQIFAEATVMALYRIPSYKREQSEPGIDAWTVVSFHGEYTDAIRAGIQMGNNIGTAVNSARDYSNEPPNVLNPVEMATRARAMAQRTGLKCTILGEAEMAAEKMNILLAVSRGSHNEAQFIILEHAPEGHEQEAPLVFVGKGITFDTGGISIKPSERMEEMKHDMSGAAAVIGAMEAIRMLNIPRRVIGAAAAVENMPDGNAFRPGDILTGMTGKSCEILSTDAEGRLILADALGYVARFSPSAVIDLATLTGAIGIALGPHAAGIFSNQDWLKDYLLKASDSCGERIWPMPMYDEYMDAIKGDMGEVKNSGGRAGGVSTSAKFIEHFTEGYPWAHLDIAAVAWTGSDKDALNPKGATGWGVRLLVALARQADTQTERSVA